MIQEKFRMKGVEFKKGGDIFSSVPRLPAWSFLRLICEGNLPPPLFFPLQRSGKPGLPPQISLEKYGALPPVTPKRYRHLSSDRFYRPF